MKSLQSYYLQKRRDSQKPSGSGSGKTTVWPYYHSLNFLTDNVTPKETLSNVPSTRFASKDRQPTARTDMLSRQSELMERAIAAFDTNSTDQPQKSKSDDEVFSEMVLKSIEKIPDSGDKDELKIEILSLISI